MKKALGLGLVTITVFILISFSHATLVGYLSNSVTASVLVMPWVNIPGSMDDCMSGGWINLTTLSGNPFTNQGACVSYVQTHMCEDWEILNEMYGLEFSGPNAYGQCVAYFSSANDKGDGDE